VSRIVVKVGGAVAASAAQQIRELAAEHEVLVVHGAGPQITRRMAQADLPVEFVGGRRVTSAAALAIVTESLAEVNAGICAALGALAQPFPEGGLEATIVRPLGFVGDPVPWAPPAIVDTLAAGRVPVVATLARGPLNVNGDDAAAALAVGIRADRLLFITDVPGVLLDGVVTRALDADEAERLIDAGTFTDGIVPKLLAAARAARRGIHAEIGETAVTA
jgi:acetylglutamate kinase